MSDCMFCTKIIKTRKPHRCVGCWAPIPMGEECSFWSGVFDGEISSNYMHRECANDWDGEEFTPGDFPVPQRIRELYSAPTA